MPNKDGTGPAGAGSKTGRQEGNCEGAQALERGQGKGQGRMPCRGQGRRLGCGRGRR